MNDNQIVEQNQAIKNEVAGVISSFVKEFCLGTLLNRCNITKTRGASPLIIFEIVFSLAFSGKNLFQGVVRNKNVNIGKDTVYEFLNNPSYNWRRLNFLLVAKLYRIISGLLNPPSQDSEGVLIFDDSTYDRNRSKKVELLARVFDHTFMKYFKGFRMLTLGWSDGNSFLGLDFALLSSANESNRYQGITKKNLDKRSCGYKRREEAVTKSTLLLEPMVKRALNAGIKARYVLMDSWFSAPSIVEALREHLHVICMLKAGNLVLHLRWEEAAPQRSVRKTEKAQR